MRAIVAWALLFGAALVPGAADAQPPGKVLRVAFAAPPSGFDPQASGDYASGRVNLVIFDALYRFDRVDGAFRVVPNTAAAMPEISADGRTWTIRIRPGIHFDDDPVFGGRKRELTAHDYVFAFKRLLDPRTRAPGIGALDGLLEGADEVLAKARAAGRLDYDAQFAGLVAVDRHTLRLRLNFATTVLLTDLASDYLAAVAHEVVERYGDGSGWVMERPVGTGPYRLAEWQPGHRVVLARNPNYRPGPARRATHPDRIEIRTIGEAQSRMLSFESGEIDYLHVPAEFAERVLRADGTLRQAFAAAGVTMHRRVDPAIYYTYFNMEDPVVGGYTPDRIALRRAVAMAYDVEQDVRVVQAGQAVAATQLIPPGVSGHEPSFRARPPHDPAAARALLERYGYRDRDGDGWREQPDGSPLMLTLALSTSASRAREELWLRSTKAIGLRLDIRRLGSGDFLKASSLGQLQMASSGMGPTPPEGIFYLDLLYGPFAGNLNHSRFALPAFDRLYEQARAMPHGPARNRLLRQASELVSTHAPMVLGTYGIRTTLVQPWVKGFPDDPFDIEPWAQLDVSPRRGLSARR